MEVFQFGDKEMPLVGYYHPPSSEANKMKSIVICHPIGHEYNRTYRCLRNLATELAKAGFNVLRFNYYAMGDSSGDTSDATIKQWLNDVELACKEIVDMSGEKNLSVIGFRFGAALALKTAEKIKFNKILLWEPVLDEKTYLTTLKTMHKDMLSDGNRFYQPDLESTYSDIELLGHPFSKNLQSEIDQLAVGFANLKRAKSVHLISSEHEKSNLTKENEGKVQLHSFEDLGRWDDIGNIENMLIANTAVSEIVGLMEAS